MKIFDPEGMLMQVLGKLSDIVLINITFVLFSLPVLTIGASITAMYECCFSLIEDTEDVFLPRQFFKSFIKNWKRGTGAWAVTLAGIAFLGSYSWVTGFFDGILGRMYTITFWILIFLFAFGVQYVFPLIAQTDMKLVPIWKRAWKLAVLALPWSLLNLVILVGLSVLATTMIPANTALYLWAFVFFGLITFFSSFVVRIVFKNYGGNK